MALYARKTRRKDPAQLTAFVSNFEPRHLQLLVAPLGLGVGVLDAAAQPRAHAVGVVERVDLVEKVQGGFTEFDVAIATPAMMRHVGKLGRILGPQGKMPSPNR